MSYEEKDWILRQIKQIAKGLGQMLGRESIKEIVNLEMSESEQLSDEELDDILLLLDVEEKVKQPKQIEVLTGIKEDRFQELVKDYSLLTEEERIVLKKYTNK
ncbi:hypothetical protein [Vagococcus fluvialis]|uniref:hypothetical protein n=1 Tax=Vagococcus fluvialis TaxID=2738 RepID=UPI001A8D6DFB|nr:hypothetical protein [Vagococcus fluvialis]MBO0436640.1 hypothetical protein [Vagococcus fluvialis]